MRIIGYLLLARLRMLVAIGRIGYRLACRYGQIGGFSVFAIAAYEYDLRAKYGLPMPAWPNSGEAQP